MNKFIIMQNITEGSSSHGVLKDILNNKNRSKKFIPYWDKEPKELQEELKKINNAIYVYFIYNTDKQEVSRIILCRYTKNESDEIGYNEKIREINSDRYLSYIREELLLSIKDIFSNCEYVRCYDELDLLYERLNEFIYYNFLYNVPNAGKKRLYENTDEENSKQYDCNIISSSKAFRRLEDKAQIFSFSKGAHFRTRLTHSIEVSNIAVDIAETIRLDNNEDRDILKQTVKAISLGHDIGHTPFGHQGERTLNSIIKGEIPSVIQNSGKELYEAIGGFKHNIQSVRVLTVYENNGFKYKGLNNSYEVLEGILKHSDFKKYLPERIIDERYSDKLHLSEDDNHFLSGKIVAIADEIAQRCADIEDAIISKNIELDYLLRILNVKNIVDLKIEIENSINNIIIPPVDKSNVIIMIIQKKLCKFFIKDIIDNYKSSNKVQFTERGEHLNDIIDKMIKNRVILSNEVSSFDDKGKEIVSKLFECYYNNPRLLNDNAIKKIYLDMMESKTCWQYAIDFRNMDKTIVDWEIRLYKLLKFDNGDISIDIDKCNDEKEKQEMEKMLKECGGLDRIYDKQRIIIRDICDYIAGMTDTFAINEYKEKVLKL